MEKSVHVEDRTVTLSDGAVRTVHLYALGGAIGLGELNDKGELEFVGLRRIRTSRRTPTGCSVGTTTTNCRRPTAAGPSPSGCVTTTRTKARKLNRTENVRPIPPWDPDFKQIYARRSDSESINRGLEDTLYLGRAHSIGYGRQNVNLLGYALMLNWFALHEHRQRWKLGAAA